MESITIDRLKNELEFFNKMYDIVRIVDPIEKRVLEYKNSTLVSIDEICYGYWKNGLICDNCISIRAYKDNKSFMKLEYNPEFVMLVTAIPIENKDRPIVLELLKNATDSMLIGTGDYNDGHMLINVVSKMNDMIIKDSLTSMYNRRFADERLPVDIVKATLEQTPLTLMFFDVDNLKYVNDKYGHGMGDLVIKEVGKILKNSIRTDKDWIARLGGDEFIISLNNTNHHEASVVADRIHKNISNAKIQIENKEIFLSVSMGMHTMDKTKLTPEELISYADKDMYLKKKSKKRK